MLTPKIPVPPVACSKEWPEWSARRPAGSSCPSNEADIQESGRCRRGRPIADRRRPWQAALWLFRTSHSRRPQHFQLDNVADVDVSLNRASRQARSGRDHTYRSIKQDRRSFADYWPETSKKDRCQDLGRCQLWLRPNITCYGSLSDRQMDWRSDGFLLSQPTSHAFSRP